MTSQSLAQPAETTPPAGALLRAWLRLANLQFTARLTTALLDRFGHDPQAILAATDAELDEVSGFQPRHLVRLRDPALEATDRQVAWIERYGVQIVRLGQPNYPRLLRDIPDPPALLFVRGSLVEADRLGVGIVGSRHATPYGRATAERLARELCGHGLTLLSGGAVGIDAAAHRGALAAGGRTLAVLGCGLDVDYPRENRALFEQVAANGALVSEYPLGAQPEAWRFPVRNRVISGLSLGVLVVEAPRQSGALITATRAVEQGRPVMVVPGNIDRPASAGSNELLKDGATPITCVEDVLRALNMVVLPARREHQHSLERLWTLEPTQGAESGLHATSEEAAMDGLSPVPNMEGGLRAGHSAGDALNLRLPDTQRRLLECLSLTPRHIDALAQEASMTAVQAGVEMTLLELNGLVRRLPGNTYIRTV
jgi:DNA processing protein